MTWPLRPTGALAVALLCACSGSTTSDSATPSDSATTTDSWDTGYTAPAQASWSDGILELDQQASLGPGSTWTGIAADDDRIYVSLKHQNHLWLHTLDHDLNDIGDRIQLTFDDDVPDGMNLADHKLLRLGERLYVAWNPNKQNDLFIVAYDLDGNRIGDQVTVESDTDTNTADMHLTTDGNSITLIYGDAGLTRRLAVLDRDLALVQGPFEITLAGKIDQLGTTIHSNGRWYMFGGDETSQNLTVSFFDDAWTPEDPFTKVLVAGEPGEWNFFPSGADRSADFGIWSTVYNYIPPGGDYENDSTLELAVMDQDLNWSQHFDVGDAEYHAGDVTSRGACVFVAAASGNVTVDRYRIKPPDNWEGDPPVCGSGG